MGILGAGGEAVPAMASLSAVAEEVGMTYAVVLTDLSRLKAAEDALRKANDALEARVVERTAELSKAVDALRAEVAERARLEGELRRHAEALMEADGRKDESFHAGARAAKPPVAHPLRDGADAPMRSDAETVERCRNVIERQARNLSRLVDDSALCLARHPRGGEPPTAGGRSRPTVVWSAVESSCARSSTRAGTCSALRPPPSRSGIALTRRASSRSS